MRIFKNNDKVIGLVCVDDPKEATRCEKKFDQQYLLQTVLLYLIPLLVVLGAALLAIVYSFIK